MENAGRGASEVIDQHFGPRGRAIVNCGVGNNGGDGCVIARHLHNRGWQVRVLVLGDGSRATPDMAANLHIVRAMGISVIEVAEWSEHRTLITASSNEDILIDALLGTGASGPIRPPVRDATRHINATRKRAVVAVDVPSGLDCDTGVAEEGAVHADLTVTFVALKVGFVVESASSYLGLVEVVDIGAPKELIQQVIAESGE